METFFVDLEFQSQKRLVESELLQFHGVFFGGEDLFDIMFFHRLFDLLFVEPGVIG